MSRQNGLGFATLLSMLLVLSFGCKSKDQQPAKPGGDVAKQPAGQPAKPAPKPADKPAEKPAGGQPADPPADPPKAPEGGQPLEGEAGEVAVKVQRTMVEVERALEEGQKLYADKKFPEAIKKLEEGREKLRWIEVQVKGQKDKLDRIEKILTQVKADKLEYDRERAITEQNAARDREIAAERERTNRIRERVERLFREANRSFRLEDYQQAALLYKEIMRLDPTNEDARRFYDIANLSQYRKVADQGRRDLIEEWLKLTERTDMSSLTQKDLVLFADEDAWREVMKRRPRESGQDSGQQDDSETLAIKEKLKRKVTLDFSGTPLPDVVQFLRETTNVNMVLDKAVVTERGEEELKVDLKVDQLEVESALKLILELKQLGYTIKNGVVFITGKDKIGGTAESRVYNVRDLTLKIQEFTGPELDLTAPSGAGGGGTTIGGTTDEDGGVTIDALQTLIQDNIAKGTWEGENTIKTRNGMLVIRHTPEVHSKVQQLLSDLRSSVGLLVSIESRFLTVTDEMLTDIGVEWRGLGSNDPPPGFPAGIAGGNNAPQLANQFNDASFFLDDIIFGGTGDVASGGSAAGGPNSGGVPVNGSDPSAGFFDRLGRQGGGGSIRGRTENLIDVFATALGPTNALIPSPTTPAMGGLDLAWAFIDGVSAQVLLRAAEKSSRVSIIQAPRVTAFNTQRANVAVLNQITYIKDFDVEVAENAAIGDPEIGTVQDGVVLDVRPVVSADRRYVTLELRPTLANVVITTVTSSIASGSGSTSVVEIETPNVTLRKLRTTVTMPDGGTMLVGGLSQYQQFTTEAGAPILSDIPIVTFFFSRERKNRVRKNLLILVKAEILALEEYEPRTEADSGVR